MSDVEIFSIGDELLRGIVADSNSHWMAKRIASRGAALQRVTTLPDDPGVVAPCLVEAIRRKPTLIVTQGGLGPTDDDRTREAVARALNVSLVPDEVAQSIVERRYRSLGKQGRVQDDALNEDRARMGLVPEGGTALDNGIGGAPGLLIRIDSVTLVCLPGVPSELAWIWEHSLAPHLDRIVGPGGFCEKTVTLNEQDESRIASTLRLIAQRHPEVYVKSRATAFDQPDSRVRLTLAASARSDENARALVERCFTDALDTLRDFGVSVDSTGEHRPH